MSKKLVDITQEEWDKYEWIDSTEPGVYLRVFEKSEPPPMPTDGFSYYLVELTALGDKRRSWTWARKQTYAKE